MNAPLARGEIETTADGRKIFRPDGRVLRDFMRSTAHVQIIRGPIGSGKTLVVINKIWQIACAQKPNPFDGKRRTRWAVVRDTYAELEGSTVKDWLDWFPEGPAGSGGYGTMYWGRPLEYHMECGDVIAEIVFIALDNPEDVKKLRSTQFTGFWFNELQYTAREIFMEAESRTGRYPALKDGGATWDGVIGDMNEPSEDHWLAQMTGEVPYPEDMSETERAELRWPKEWDYFVQPAALIEVFEADGKTVRGYRVNPKAENLRYLKPTYYAEKVRGKTKQWIDSRLMNRVTIFVEGSPVWPEFKLETHVAKAELRIHPGHTLFIGLDFGRSPAAVFGQLVNDRWNVLDELVGHDVSAQVFAPLVKRKIEQRFGFLDDIRIFGDPKGDDQDQKTEGTAYDIYRANGLYVQPAPVKNNNIMVRVETVSFLFNEMRDGVPRAQFDPVRVRTLKVACAGKYHREKIRGANGAVKELPKKNAYSNCFPAGTPISTPKGNVPIERIGIGDWVCTPNGARRVRATMSRDARDFAEVAVTDGRKIICTPDHPFAVKGGFVRADALRYMENIYSEGEQWDGQQNILFRNSTAADITGCQQTDIFAATRSSAARSCIAMFGNLIAERFQTVFTSIIATMMLRIIELKTCISNAPPITRGITIENVARLAGCRERPSIWRKSACLLRYGIEAAKAGLGIANTPATSRQACLTKRTSARIAKNGIELNAEAGSAGFARNRVRAWREKLKELTTSTRIASSVVRAFARINTMGEKRAAAVAKVALFRLSDPIRVYDLTVDEAHCFYAHGVLVHNCADAFGYMVIGGGESRAMVGLSPHTRSEPINVRTGRRSLRRAR